MLDYGIQSEIRWPFCTPRDYFIEPKRVSFSERIVLKSQRGTKVCVGAKIVDPSSDGDDVHAGCENLIDAVQIGITTSNHLTVHDVSGARHWSMSTLMPHSWQMIKSRCLANSALGSSVEFRCCVATILDPHLVLVLRKIHNSQAYLRACFSSMQWLSISLRLNGRYTQRNLESS
jgi:hypothetical protein